MAKLPNHRAQMSESKSHTVNFISSLPRSGSTLMCNILAQNPRFQSTHTSGCLDLLFNIRNNWHNQIEHQAHPDDEALDRVLKAAFNAYHGTEAKPIVFDKSRGWLAHLELAEKVLGRPAKVIVNIRPLVDILTSFEKLHRATAAVKQPPGEAENYFQFQTVMGRCQYWTRPSQVIGLAMNRLDDVVRRGLKDRLHIVDFNKLTSNPEQTVAEIYDFLGERYFKHNFDHVEQVTHEDDTIHGYIDLHTIRNKVEPIKSQAVEILGQDVVNAFSNVNSAS